MPMKYVVIVEFSDLQDNNKKYLVGDSFPRKGLIVSEKRLEELASSNNRRGFPVIEAVAEAEPAVVEEKKEQAQEAKTTTKRGKKKNDTNRTLSRTE